MRLGISSWAFQWLAGRPNHPPETPLSPLGLLDKASELGVSVVQIADNLPLHTYSDEVIHRFGEEAHKRNITIELGTHGIDVDNLLRYLEIAKQYGFTLVRANFPRPEKEKEAVDLLKASIHAYEEAGVFLALENYDHFPVSELAHIIRAVDSENIGACLDPGNSLSCNEDTERVIDTLAPLTFNLHVKDLQIFREPYNMGFIVEGRACGQGQIDLPQLINRTKKEAPRDINAILECWTPWQGSLQASLDVEDTWIKDSISYLKTLIPN